MFWHANSWSRHLNYLRGAAKRRGKKQQPRRNVSLDVERLENRWLFTVGITEYLIPTSAAGPVGITPGPDGNLWFTESGGNKVSKITTGGNITEYGLGSTVYDPQWITTGPDGNLWVDEPSQAGGLYVAKSTTAGVVTQYSVDSGSPHNMGGICAGPDGNLWFTEVVNTNHTPPTFTGRVGKISTSGTVTLYTVTTHSSSFMLGGIVAGPDGNLWFTDETDNLIVVMTTGGTILHQYTVPTGGSDPLSITQGPDGNLWFTELMGDKIARITTDGSITEFLVPTTGSDPYGITTGLDGNLWFTENIGNKVAFLNPSNGSFTEYALSASTGPEGITVGPNGTLWWAEYTANKIGTFDWGLLGGPAQGGPVQGDPGQQDQEPIPGQIGSWYSAHTGNLHVEVPLDFMDHVPD
jgi:virginiamycin B lyase